MKLGDKLREARNTRELSLRQIETRLKAKGINYSHTNIKRIEDGEFEKIPVNVLDALCDIYMLDKVEMFNLAGANLKSDNKNRIATLNKEEKKELNKFIGEVGYFFNDESVSEEDKEKFLIALQEMFFKAKFLKNKE